MVELNSGAININLYLYIYIYKNIKLYGYVPEARPEVGVERLSFKTLMCNENLVFFKDLHK